MTKFLFSTFCCCSLFFSVFAQLVNGINYNFDGSTATVLPSNPKYSGNIDIPSTVFYEGTNYTVTSIGAEAFFDCTSLTSVTLPNSIRSIGKYTFGKCTSLTTITLPNSITCVGDGVFSKCTSLNSITLPNSITTIGSDAFLQCTSLTSITLPNNLTSIGNWAFYDCRNLASITILAIDPPKLEVYTFYNVPVNTPVYISSISYNNYRNAFGWKNFTNFVELPKAVVVNNAEPMEEFKRCPYCGEEILAVAIKCKHCGEWLDKTATSKKQPTTKKSQGVVLENPFKGVALGVNVLTGFIFKNSYSDVGFGAKLSYTFSVPFRLAGEFDILWGIPTNETWFLTHRWIDYGVSLQYLFSGKGKRFAVYPLVGIGGINQKIKVNDGFFDEEVKSSQNRFALTLGYGIEGLSKNCKFFYGIGMRFKIVKLSLGTYKYGYRIHTVAGIGYKF